MYPQSIFPLLDIIDSPARFSRVSRLFPIEGIYRKIMLEETLIGGQW